MLRDVRWVTVVCLDSLNLVLGAFVWRWPQRLPTYVAVTALLGELERVTADARERYDACRAR